METVEVSIETNADSLSSFRVFLNVVCPSIDRVEPET
jgi:hypothetical protein